MAAEKPTVTPMMAQFLEIKSRHRDALLFYRMGDFYEMFFDAAIAASQALDIALTKRGKHDGDDIPMCGVPVHAAENYFHTLIRKGFRVAVCEQLESPAEAKKRGAKSVVKRDVVRLVTPGTLTEDSLLEARRHNFLAAFAEVRDEGALAWVDISTGAFHVMPCPLIRLAPELARLNPSEMIVSEANPSNWAELVPDFDAATTPLSRSSFDSTSAAKRLQELFGVHPLAWRKSPPWGQSLIIWKSHKRANFLWCAPPCVKILAARCRSMRPHGAILRSLMHYLADAKGH